MTRLRALYHITRADFLDRIRRYSSLVTLGFVLFLGHSVHRGDLMLRLERYRGVFNSAWAGSMMTLVVTTILSLAGFYLVKNAIERDRRTGVGQILAATPMRRPAYTLAKTLSNFAFLASMVAVLAVLAILLQLSKGEGSRLEPGTLLSPFLWVALPCMLVTSALAVLFEAVPWLSGSAGNVLYFVLWSGLLVVGFQHSPAFDYGGFRLIGSSMQAAAQAAYPNYRGGIDLTFAGVARPEAGTFIWNGIQWTWGVIAARLWFVIVAIGLALIAAVPFDRFDTSRQRPRWRRSAIPSENENIGESAEEVSEVVPASLSPTHFSAAALSRAPLRIRFVPLYLAELRLLVRGAGRLWQAVALGLVIASLLAPLPVVRSYLLPIAWIWPILLWSGMGTRERRYDTEPLLFSALRPLTRQLPALWLAGATVSFATGLGAGLRLLVADDLPGLATWVAGMTFIPSLALALGVWSGSGKLFEAIYMSIWYIGPFRKVPILDFIGTTETPERMTTTGTFLLAAGLLITLAAFGRRLRIGGR